MSFPVKHSNILTISNLVQRRATTELLIDAGIPLVGTLLIVFMKGVSLGFPEEHNQLVVSLTLQNKYIIICPPETLELSFNTLPR